MLRFFVESGNKRKEKRREIYRSCAAYQERMWETSGIERAYRTANRYERLSEQKRATLFCLTDRTRGKTYGVYYKREDSQKEKKCYDGALSGISVAS